ncbi:Zinc finger, RING/FYVE/PHD-type [Phytophthora cactorum]|nr:Zinc finger, RING/FYVE/PHD-type [Phytophthora cactorum]
MGSPSACDECGKKFKVFGLKKKCKHCMDVVCKSCLAAHLELKHTHLNGPPRCLRHHFRRYRQRRRPGAAVPVPHWVSGLGARIRRPRVPRRAGRVDGVDAISDEEDDGDLLDYDAEDDAEDDELVMTTLTRQSSIEEEEIQYLEMHKIQGAVATWAIKEKQAKMDLRVSKKESYCAMSPVFQEVCDYENCSVFAVSYAVMATVVVWAVFGLLLALYLRARSLPAGFSYVL